MGNQKIGMGDSGLSFWANAGFWVRAVGIAAAICAALGTRSAHAEAGVVISNYEGRGCLNAISRQPYASISGTAIKAGVNTAEVACPIVKNTSGPNIGFTLDGIQSVNFSVDFSGSQPSGANASATCSVRILNSNVFFDQMFPVLSLSATANGPGVQNFVVGPFDNRVAGFWSQQWYTDIDCVLSPGTALSSYVVRELGYQQSSYIYSSASCGPASGNTGDWFASAGLIEELQPTSPPNAQFWFTCPFGTNRRNSRVDYFGFENGVSATTVRTSVASNSIPAKLHPDFPFMTTVAAASGAQFSPSVDVLSLASGDGRLISYRLSGDATLKVDAGGAANYPFAADTYSTTNATPIPASVAIDTSRVNNPPPDDIYRTNHLGAATYTLNGFTPGISHNVRLHFVESYWTAAGKRKFNVKVNNTQVLTNFDIFATAGARYRAVDNFSFVAADANGRYNIALTNVTDQALLAGIEIY
jgi:hypothetical protein